MTKPPAQQQRNTNQADPTHMSSAQIHLESQRRGPKRAERQLQVSPLCSRRTNLLLASEQSLFLRRFEYDYARSTKGVERIVAAVMEPSCRVTSKWTGSIGGRLGGRLYTDLTADQGTDAFATAVDKLADEIQKASSAAVCGIESLRTSTTSSKQSETPHRTKLATIPPEVPVLPSHHIDRFELITALKQRVLHLEHTTNATAVTAAPAYPGRRNGKTYSGNATAASGMGGVGKTVAAAALVRSDEVRATFDKICWVSIGQDPDLPALQHTLYIQLAKCSLPEASKSDERLALAELKEASQSFCVLLILDDVWDTSHATLLNFVEPSDRHSAVVITTRLSSVISNAAEVQCGVLSQQASLELLLRTGGCEDLLGAPPEAALEAVELCAHLPLTLSIAGRIIAELADDWQSDLIPLFKNGSDEDSLTSVEERVVMASLQAVPGAIRAGVEAVFTVFALFAEDASVSPAAIDVVAPLVLPEGEAGAPGAQQRRSIRQWLLQLLKSNLLQGSIEDGVSAHDLVRDCMTRRAEAREGGLRSMQRQAVLLFLASFEADGPAVGYIAKGLQWHVRSAVQPGVLIQDDELMMHVLTHSSGVIQGQGAMGIGSTGIWAAAHDCSQTGEHLTAAILMYAAGVPRGKAAGAELRQAWASLQSLESKMRDASAARALEHRVLNALVFATSGGFTFSSVEYAAAVDRLQVLSDMPRATGETTVPSPRQSDERSLARLAMLAAYQLEGVSGYQGPMSHESVLQSHKHWLAYAAHGHRAAAAAPDSGTTMVLHCFLSKSISFPRQHTLAEFSLEALMLGEDGSTLRQNIER